MYRNTVLFVIWTFSVYLSAVRMPVRLSSESPSPIVQPQLLGRHRDFHLVSSSNAFVDEDVYQGLPRDVAPSRRSSSTNQIPGVFVPFLSRHGHDLGISSAQLPAHDVFSFFNLGTWDDEFTRMQTRLGSALALQLWPNTRAVYSNRAGRPTASIPSNRM